MVSFSPRRCAVALLCTALVLGSFNVRAASITVNGDVSKSGETFNGDSITFDLGSVRADVATVQLINSEVTGSGLTIQGYTGSVPSGVTARVSMSVASTTVNEATIAFKGVMPENSDIRLVAATGSLTASQSLFDFTGLQLSGNVTVTVEACSVTWPSGAASTGSIITYGNGDTSIGLSNKGALFVLNSTAINGASVLHINAAASRITVSDNSVLAIDYSRCEKCTQALVNIEAQLTVDTSSLFRVSHSTVVGASNGLLTSGGSVTVSHDSLYVVSSCTVESGSLFNYDSGDSTDSGAFSFAVTDSSTVSFLGLTGPSTGVPAAHPIPSSVDSTSTINGGSCTIAGTTLATLADYTAVGLGVTQVVNSEGANGSSTCANSICVPGNSNAGAAATSGTACTCSCTSSLQSAPSCTAMTDPTQTFQSDATCSVANCASCDRLYPTSRCTECNTGYDLTEAYTCQEHGVEPTTTTTTTTTTSTTAPTQLCTVAFCATCLPNDGSTCATCRNGYTLTNGYCLISSNAAAGAQTALVAAAVCVAAAVYAL